MGKKLENEETNIIEQEAIKTRTMYRFLIIVIAILLILISCLLIYQFFIKGDNKKTDNKTTITTTTEPVAIDTSSNNGKTIYRCESSSYYEKELSKYCTSGKSVTITCKDENVCQQLDSSYPENHYNEGYYLILDGKSLNIYKNNSLIYENVGNIVYNSEKDHAILNSNHSGNLLVVD